MGHPEIFFSEVLNDTEAGINSRTDLSLIKPWPWQEHELPQGKFIVIDPSNNKRGGDDVSIGAHSLLLSQKRSRPPARHGKLALTGS